MTYFKKQLIKRFLSKIVKFLLFNIASRSFTLDDIFFRFIYSQKNSNFQIQNMHMTVNKTLHVDFQEPFHFFHHQMQYLNNSSMLNEAMLEILNLCLCSLCLSVNFWIMIQACHRMDPVEKSNFTILYLSHIMI